MPWKCSEAYEIGMAGTAGITAAPFCIMVKYYGYEDMKDTVCNLYEAISIHAPDHHPGATNFAECGGELATAARSPGGGLSRRGGPGAVRAQLTAMRACLSDPATEGKQRFLGPQ